jgi:hypothetical protein
MNRKTSRPRMVLLPDDLQIHKKRLFTDSKMRTQ